MLKKPDNKLIALTFMLLAGLALIFIPLIQQRQEIEEDNNIYTMIMEEIQHQQASVSETEATPDVESESAPLPEEFPSEEAEEILTESVEHDSTEVPAEEPVPENPEADLPPMIIEEITEPTEAEKPAVETRVPVTVPGTSQPSNSPAPAPTKRPAATAKPTQKPPVENADYIATISIPGTVINYPVVRSDRTEYYLHHLINGQESKLGTLFSLTTSDYETPSRNIAIYGHHLSNSTAMFSTLMEYKSLSYWKSHPYIKLVTAYGVRTYKIFAVLNHTVSDWDASTASFKDDAAFMKFVNRARKKSFYDTGVEVSETDHIITLITCDRSYGGVQGRLLVMGVEVREE